MAKWFSNFRTQAVKRSNEDEPNAQAFGAVLAATLRERDARLFAQYETAARKPEPQFSGASVDPRTKLRRLNAKFWGDRDEELSP